MKSLNKMMGLTLLLVSGVVGAENIQVKGVPVTLVPYQQIYQLPPNYVASSNDYLYVTVDGMNNVCYLQPNAALQALKMHIIIINMNGQNTNWNCYETQAASAQGTQPE